MPPQATVNDIGVDLKWIGTLEELQYVAIASFCVSSPEKGPKAPRVLELRVMSDNVIRRRYDFFAELILVQSSVVNGLRIFYQSTSTTTNTENNLAPPLLQSYIVVGKPHKIKSMGVRTTAAV